MKQKNLFLILVLSFAFSPARSQELKNFTLGFELGSEFVTGQLNKNWNVRKNVGSYYYDYDYGNAFGTDMTISSVGIKPEFSFFKNRIGISSGLLYTQISSSLGKYSSDINPFFYLLNNGGTTNTEYFKVKNIQDDNDYLGIPLEVTLLPFQLEYIGFYLKAGVELNFRFHNKTDIQFYNASMEPYEQDIIRNTGITTNSIYSSFYSSVGMRFGKEDKIKYNLEILFPSTFLTTNNSALIVPDFYTGFKLSVLFPMKKSKIFKAE